MVLTDMEEPVNIHLYSYVLFNVFLPVYVINFAGVAGRTLHLLD